MREDRILDELLRRGTLLEESQRRSRTITASELHALSAGLQSLQTAIDELRSGIASADASGAQGQGNEAPKSDESDSDGEVATPTFAELEARIREHDAEDARLRALLRERFASLRSTVGTATEKGHDPSAEPSGGHAHLSNGVTTNVGPRTFRLTRPLMSGNDIRALQKVVNRRFAAWGIGLHVREDGRYGPQTRTAVRRVTKGLGLTPPTHGVTPGLRVLMRTPSRRTPKELARARANRTWLAALRKRYPATREQSPTTASDLHALIRAHDGRYEDIIVREARRHGVPVSLVCAVIQTESNFRNIFGRDPSSRNPVKSPPPPAVLEVTEERYRKYLRYRTNDPLTFQGVGPAQLTWHTVQDRADQLGGCWKPGPNIRAGVELLAKNVNKHGLRAGVARYNGSGPAAERAECGRAEPQPRK